MLQVTRHLTLSNGCFIFTNPPMDNLSDDIRIRGRSDTTKRHYDRLVTCVWNKIRSDFWKCNTLNTDLMHLSMRIVEWCIWTSSSESLSQLDRESFDNLLGLKDVTCHKDTSVSCTIDQSYVQITWRNSNDVFLLKTSYDSKLCLLCSTTKRISSTQIHRKILIHSVLVEVFLCKLRILEESN